MDQGFEIAPPSSRSSKRNVPEACKSKRRAHASRKDGVLKTTAYSSVENLMGRGIRYRRATAVQTREHEETEIVSKARRFWARLRFDESDERYRNSGESQLRAPEGK